MKGQSCRFLSADMFSRHEQHPTMIIVENSDNYTLVLSDFGSPQLDLPPHYAFFPWCATLVSETQCSERRPSTGQAGFRPSGRSASGTHGKLLTLFKSFAEGEGLRLLSPRLLLHIRHARGVITLVCQHFPWLCGEGSLAFRSYLKYVRSHL